MDEVRIKDFELLAATICRFMAFVQSKDKKENGLISFTEEGSYLFAEEGYKSSSVRKAQEVLRADEWDEGWIGTGKIAACSVKAIRKAGNLVSRYQKTEFKNWLNREHAEFKPEAEEVLFHIFSRTYPEEISFNEAVKTFGREYDRIAYLFYLKDPNVFLPISSGHFDTSFKMLNIDFHTASNCSWENYVQFLNICDSIKDVMYEIMRPVLQRKPRLIDAHSFLWIIQLEGKGRFLEWKPDAETEALIEENTEIVCSRNIEGKGGIKVSVSHPFSRSAAVAEAARKRANGVCQLCGSPAPFMIKDEPFLEVHHVEWLSHGGKDSTDNTVALCPNCHRKMHLVNDLKDNEKLCSIINSYKVP